MALQVPYTSSSETIYPDSYWRNEKIIIEQIEGRAFGIFRGYPNKAAADLAKAIRQNPAAYPGQFVTTIDTVEIRIEGMDFYNFAMAQLQQQNNILTLTYEVAKDQPIFEGAVDV